MNSHQPTFYGSPHVSSSTNPDLAISPPQLGVTEIFSFEKDSTWRPRGLGGERSHPGNYFCTTGTAHNLQNQKPGQNRSKIRPVQDISPSWALCPSWFRSKTKPKPDHPTPFFSRLTHPLASADSRFLVLLLPKIAFVLFVFIREIRGFTLFPSKSGHFTTVRPARELNHHRLKAGGFNCD